MSRICDRSPCDPLLNALGSYIFRDIQSSGEGFYMVVSIEGRAVDVSLEYCPSCGTRLEEVPAIVVEKFTRQRRRRRVSKPVTS